MDLLINDANLKNYEIQEFNTKVRAILVDKNNQILIANYGNIILLPGGKVDKGETKLESIIRELKEELGVEYSKEELEFFATLNFYQKNYPKRDKTFLNRLIQTTYFIGSYKDVKKDDQKLTEKEQKDNFRLELISLEHLEHNILHNKTNNPRNIYFKKELLTILDSYKKLKQTTKVKKLSRK